jgi:hypothetical protein
MEGSRKVIDVGNVSRYNSGALINLRLNELWQDAHKHKRNAQYSSWNGDLDAVWCELAGDVIEDSEKDKKFIELNKDLSKESPIINWGGSTGFNEITQSQKLKRQKQYLKLIKKEVFLRRLQNVQGKGTAYNDDDDGWE